MLRLVSHTHAMVQLDYKIGFWDTKVEQKTKMGKTAANWVSFDFNVSYSSC